MEIAFDAWLSDIFGYSVFRLTPPDDPEECANDLILHCSGVERAMYYTKIPTSEVRRSHLLEKAGFYVVDVNTTFELTKDASAPVDVPDDIFIGDTPKYHEEVLNIASTCFRYSRFHLDHLVPNAIANRIKREWISSYIQRKRGDKLFVAVKGDAPVGFLAATTGISDGKRTAIIELIGVDLAFQGQGIGMALVGTFIRTYRNTCEVLQVGTQAVNIPSMRLYERMGFSIVDTKYVMHLHYGI